MWRTESVDTTVVMPILVASKLASVLLPVPLVPARRMMTQLRRSRMLHPHPPSFSYELAKTRGAIQLLLACLGWEYGDELLACMRYGRPIPELACL